MCEEYDNLNHAVKRFLLGQDAMEDEENEKQREKYPCMPGLENSNDRNERRVQANFLFGLS